MPPQSMAGHMGLLPAQGVDQPDRVGARGRPGCRPGTPFGLSLRAVPPLVRHDDAEARGGQRLDLMAPAVPEFGKAVQQEDEGGRPRVRPRSRAGGSRSSRWSGSETRTSMSPPSSSTPWRIIPRSAPGLSSNIPVSRRVQLFLDLLDSSWQCWRRDPLSFFRDEPGNRERRRRPRPGRPPGVGLDRCAGHGPPPHLGRARGRGQCADHRFSSTWSRYWCWPPGEAGSPVWWPRCWPRSASTSFFFHPVGTFTVADPANWVALLSFSCGVGARQPLGGPRRAPRRRRRGGGSARSRCCFAKASHLEAVRESEALKTALLRAVSHDLRTPLTAMRLGIESLEARPLHTSGDARERAWAGFRAGPSGPAHRQPAGPGAPGGGRGAPAAGAPRLPAACSVPRARASL